MAIRIRGPEDLVNLESRICADDQASHAAAAPVILNVEELLSLKVPQPEMLIEGILPDRAASLLVGAPKSGKTIFATQLAITVASGAPLFGRRNVIRPGPVLIVEEDDPAGPASIKEILSVSPISVHGIPFQITRRAGLTLSPEFLTWLEEQIQSRRLVLVVLDSFTALRKPRQRGVDIVKAEQSDLAVLDELAKRTGCAIVIIHHTSKGSASANWTQQAAGTFAMSGATEAQIHVARFDELDINASERLVRIRGRHMDSCELVLSFRKETMNYDFVLEGTSASSYPLILHLRSIFGERSFGPKELLHETGISRASAHRQIERLCRGEVLRRVGYGEYALR